MHGPQKQNEFPTTRLRIISKFMSHILHLYGLEFFFRCLLSAVWTYYHIILSQAKTDIYNFFHTCAHWRTQSTDKTHTKVVKFVFYLVNTENIHGKELVGEYIYLISWSRAWTHHFVVWSSFVLHICLKRHATLFTLVFSTNFSNIIFLPVYESGFWSLQW